MKALENYPQLMSPDEVSEYLGVSPHALKTWRQKERGPKYIKLGESQNSTIRYDREDVQAYVNARKIAPRTTEENSRNVAAGA